MQVPPDISFRNMEPSDAIEADVRDHIAKLEEVYDRITSCKVVVTAPHQEAPTGEPYHVRIYLAVPQHDIVVDRDPATAWPIKGMWTSRSATPSTPPAAN